MIDHVDIDPVLLESDTSYSETFDVEPFDLDTVIENFIRKAKSKLDTLFPCVGVTEQQDRYIAESVLQLFEKIDNLQISNKKAVFVYVKEINPGVTNIQINSVLKTLYDVYKKVYSEYLLG